MTEQYGVATRLLYQLYIALQRKKKARLTGVAMEAMRPAAPANLQTIESGIYKELLKKIVPREADLKLKQVSQRYEQKRKKTEEKVNLAHYEELRKIQKMQQDLRLQDIEKHRLVKRRQGEMMARIQAAIVQIPKPPPNRTLEAIAAQKQQRKKQEAQVSALICSSHINILQTSFQSEGLSSKYVSPSPEEKTHAYKEYIQKIHRRLEEDAAAREHREKRRRRVLLEQLKAHEAQEEAYREQQLVNRLMRQSQQERRMAVQLMHARHEKDIIRQNRIMREKQYEERRLLEFQEALDREAALAKQEKIDYMEQTRKEIELHDAIAAEYAAARYRKHFDICQDVLNQIIDLVTKAGEYRELTHNLLPAKLMREWKELFYNGKPLYEKASVDPIPSEPNPEQLLELEKLQILDDQDYEEFQVGLE
ncbi:Sperm flagellar protein 2 [Acipenser ruthenus]|uniref:Sperm flagellar protein 2 n=1 Tax=Acipenser ruthenus TaxID=7906 RepID=A0A444UTD9_ACIRT|nr:Sperm flagellar protein 2 [Acipenser ruthenus]